MSQATEKKRMPDNMIAQDASDKIVTSEQNFIALNKVAENLPGCIAWKNKEGHYLGCNTAFKEKILTIIGEQDSSYKSLLGKTDHDFYSPEIAHRYRQQDLEVIKLNKEISFEQEILLHNGTSIIQLSTKRPLYDDHHQIIGVVDTIVDITFLNAIDKKLMDEKDTAVHDLNYIISKMPGYIYWKNKKSEYMGCNELLAEFSKLRHPKDIIGKTDYDFEWGAEQAAQFVQDDQEVMRTGKSLITEHELPAKKENGKNLYVRTEKMPFYDKNGKIAGVLAIAMDITDQKELENKLREEKNKAEQANHIKTEFIRNMEHDIRTPFNGVWGMANYLMEIEENPKKKEYLTDIIQCAKELLDYCNSILDFSKIESGALPVVDKKFDLEKLIDSLIKIELPAATHKKLVLTRQYTPDMPKIVVGDGYRLHRILINLISNAIKFTPQGSIELSVAILKQSDHSILIRFMVEDTGIGIPEDKQEFIFEKFSRLSQSNKGFYKGLGLGLRVVKQFMHEMNGEIDIVSEVNKGTQFICTLPFKLPLTDDFVGTDKSYGD